MGYKSTIKLIRKIQEIGWNKETKLKAQTEIDKYEDKFGSENGNIN